MYRLFCLFVMLSGAVGCASQATQSKEFVAPTAVAMMPEIVSQTLRIESQLVNVCLKQNAHFYCGESAPVSFAKAPLPSGDLQTRMIEKWKVGSIFVDGEVVFVVVDDASHSVWTLPKKMSRLEREVKSTQSETPPAARAGYHCECPEFRRAFSAAAMMSTF